VLLLSKYSNMTLKDSPYVPKTGILLSFKDMIEVDPTDVLGYPCVHHSERMNQTISSMSESLLMHQLHPQYHHNSAQ